MSLLAWALIMVTFSRCDPAPTYIGETDRECIGWVMCKEGPIVCVSWDDGTLSNRVIDCTEERGEVGL